MDGTETQKTAIDTANESAQARADAAMSDATSFQAPDIATIEAPPQPLNLQETPAPTPLDAFVSSTPEILKETQDVQKQEKQVQSQEQDLYSALTGLGGMGEAQMVAEQKAGIPKLSTALTEIENEIAQKSLAFRRERERIIKSGGSVAQVNAELAAVGSKQNQELADLEVIRAARSNTLTNAQNLIDRQIKLKFADKQAEINALSFLYQNNKDRLTAKQDALLQKTIEREERAYQQAATEYNAFLQEQNRYLNNAAQAGADNNTLKTIKAAGSLEELYSIGAVQQYAMSPAERLDIQYKNAQIANIYDQINQRGIDAYNKQIEAALKAKDEADAGLQKSLAGAALALELQTADGLSAAIGFGIKKNPVTRTLAGGAAGAAAGFAAGSAVPVVGNVIGTGVGFVGGLVAGYAAGPEAVQGSARADYEAKADQLAAMITLSGREQLRGQGTITDSEQALLARSETILSNKNVSEKVWLDTLSQTADILNLANKRYAQMYGGIPAELGEIYGIGSNGLPVGSSISTDQNGNIVLPAGVNTVDIISDEQFWR